MSQRPIRVSAGWLALLVSATFPRASATAHAPQTIPFRVIAQGTESKIDGPHELVARTHGTWQLIWTEHAGDSPLPTVDWDREMVVAVFVGPRPTNGYAVEIIDITRRAHDLVVRYREHLPTDQAALSRGGTSPYEIVAVPRDSSYVRFTELRGSPTRGRALAEFGHDDGSGLPAGQESSADDAPCQPTETAVV